MSAFWVRRGDVVTWTSGLAVDADGCPRAYAPRNSGLPALDALKSAGHPGGWWGLVCGEDGQPVIQGSGDPAPGYYVSATALVDRSRPQTDPRRYVDSDSVPYISIPHELLGEGAHVGDVALVEYRGRRSPAVVADVGPRGKIGEGSMALARALGVDDSPVRGGVGSGVSVMLWLGSSRGWPRSCDDVAAQVESLRISLPAS